MLTAASLIVRPPRSNYKESDLPSIFRLCDGTVVKRKPVSFTNSRNQKIVGSFYKSPCTAPNNPAVIYLHGNASSQLEGTWAIDFLCPQGVSFLGMDCSGSGRSDGEYISLGLNERDDVSAAISFLREHENIGPIVLWGRSMGAATAIWCAADNMDIQGIVADSGYESIREIANDLASQSWFIWGLLKLLWHGVDRHVKKLGGYALDDVHIKGLEKATCPALFIHAASDDFIRVRQSREMYARYGAREKYLMTCLGGHNDPRPSDVRMTTLMFILNLFDIEIDIDSVATMNTEDYSFQHFRNAFDMAMHM